MKKNKEDLSEDDKIEIEIKKEALEDEMKEEKVSPSSKLSKDEHRKQQNAQKKKDIQKYWNDLIHIHKSLEGLREKVSATQKETQELKEKAKKEVEELKVQKEAYTEKNENLEIRELALSKSEYTQVVFNLLESLKETKSQIFKDTEDLIKGLSVFHKENLNDFEKTLKGAIDFEKTIHALQTKIKKLEIEKEVLEENLKVEFESEGVEDLIAKERKIKRLTTSLKNAEKERDVFKGVVNDLDAQLGEWTSDSLLKEYGKLQDKVEGLEAELNERPASGELDKKNQYIAFLKEELTQVQSKVDQKEFLDLKKLFNNQDDYVLEINSLKNRLESAGIRTDVLQRTNEDLLMTISQLKGDASEKSKAFEFASLCDENKLKYGTSLKKKNEKDFDLNRLCEYAQERMMFDSDKPFYYSLETIRIFLAGLHMSRISLLEGISGTGKTSLPREFAKALVGAEEYHGIDEQKQVKASYRICAVQSGWRDNMDLMGYYNSFEHKYKETDFFKALYLANMEKYKDTLFFIVLDEMNLSRPEHYFADFLSLLEQASNEQFISIKNTPKEFFPDLIKGGMLEIPSNIRFIGTANQDETTLGFAPKTYDRSNVMEMPKNYPDKQLDKENRTFKKKLNIPYSWLESKFEKAEAEFEDSFERFKDFLESKELKELLNEMDIGVGNRLSFQSKKFIGVFIGTGQDPKKDLAIAADHLITSRLFRTLKNRYDLEKEHLTLFKESYVDLFKKAFGNEPHFAKKLVDTAIKKKG